MSLPGGPYIDSQQHYSSTLIALVTTKSKELSSKGKVISLVDALEVYQPEVLRYIFAMNKVDHEFSISFDLDVLKVYEDYDNASERIKLKFTGVEFGVKVTSPEKVVVNDFWIFDFIHMFIRHCIPLKR